MRRWLQIWRDYRQKRDRLGARGERAAAKTLRKAGYKIVGRNVRTRLGEIDLIVRRGRERVLVIVEVKTTTSEDPPPEVHVDRHKQRKLSALAGQLVRTHQLEDHVVRFDVVGVVWPEGAKKPVRVTHHVNAFESML
ncbi:MAG: YraN family protein [Planctomycetes bacterium]|nr:YraN family protein [Planctomycetota bacterium]